MQAVGNFAGQRHALIAGRAGFKRPVAPRATVDSPRWHDVRAGQGPKTASLHIAVPAASEARDLASVAIVSDLVYITNIMGDFGRAPVRRRRRPRGAPR